MANVLIVTQLHSFTRAAAILVRRTPVLHARLPQLASFVMQAQF
jgi:hypothetical protein